MTIKSAYKNELDARKKFLIAAEQTDALRADVAKKVWEDAQTELAAARHPPEPLKTGLGGEIIPQTSAGMPGLESALKTPDLLNAEATIERANLADRAGVFDLAFEAAESVSAKNSIEQMLCHQMAAAHRRCMTLFAESANHKDPEIAIRKSSAASRIMDSFNRAALTLQRLRQDAHQTIQVQYVQINGSAPMEQGVVSQKLQNPEELQMPPRNKGGRPPTTGYRTQQAIAERQADRELILNLRKIEM
jgi:hypothetical protein